jgi:hypothetical protein
MQADRGAGHPTSSGMDEGDAPEDFKEEDDPGVPESEQTKSSGHLFGKHPAVAQMI